MSAQIAFLAPSAWSKYAHDILDHSRRASSGSIEDIQATIIIFYIVYNDKGYSAIFRSLHGIAFMMTRDLS